MSPLGHHTTHTSRSKVWFVAPVLAASLLAACVPEEPAPQPTTSTTTSSTTTSTTLPAPTAPVVSGEACQPGSGVTVVVDFTTFNNSVQIGCAPGEQTNGFTALAAAGFTFGDGGAPGTLCTIEGHPVQGYPYCWTIGGYWSYWRVADRTGEWAFSNYGAGNGPLLDGAVEGWAWHPNFVGNAPRVSIADLANYTPAAPAACAVPDAPVISPISKLETLPFSIEGDGPIEIAVLGESDDVANATWTEADELALAAYDGPIRVLARSGADACEAGAIFDATYDVRELYPTRASYSGGDGEGIAQGSSRFVGWADSVLSYTPGADVSDNWKVPANALGPIGDWQKLVVLGNGGSATFGFSTPIANGPGHDFAVFENGLADNGSHKLFAELAYVEVSSNGTDFVRFDSASRQVDKVGAFATQDPRLFAGLAGKESDGWGTVFDLDLLKNKPEVRSGLVDLDNITAIRVIDVVGDRDYPKVGDRYLDSFGRDIYDAHKTIGSGGFDLKGIGVLNRAN